MAAWKSPRRLRSRNATSVCANRNATAPIFLPSGIVRIQSFWLYLRCHEGGAVYERTANQGVAGGARVSPCRSGAGNPALQRRSVQRIVVLLHLTKCWLHRFHVAVRQGDIAFAAVPLGQFLVRPIP